MKEIVEAITTIWPANRVAVRLSPNGKYNDMGSHDFRETFLYAAEHLNKYGLAYLHLLNGLAFGFHELGTPMTLSEFRKVFKAPLMGNCGYTKESAEEDIRNASADLVAFGRPFISNPDLVERFTNNWELNPPARMKDWYSFTEEGYTDFPIHPPA
jgi:N-ethylmaleimide reductase